MALVDRDAVLNALRVVVDPDLRKDIVSLGFVKDLTIADGRASFTIELTTPACPAKDQMRDQAAAAVRAVAGVSDVKVQLTAKVRAAVFPEAGRPRSQRVAAIHLTSITTEGTPQFILCFCQHIFPLLREILSGTVKVKIQHAHGRAKRISFAPV